jgi:hypothetical protein
MSEGHSSVDDQWDELLTEASHASPEITHAFLRVMCRDRIDDDPRYPVYTDAELDALGGVGRHSD